MRSPDCLSRVVLPVAEEALCLPAASSGHSHVLFVRVPVRNTLVFQWCCGSPFGNRDRRRDTASWAAGLLADFLAEQLQAADIWADWGETGWRVGAVVSPRWLDALRKQDCSHY